MIPVTKPYLPSREKLDRYIDGIYERAWLTNNGELGFVRKALSANFTYAKAA